MPAHPKTTAATAALLMSGGAILALVGPAQADQAPPHGHMLVMGVKFGDEGPIGFEKCVDLAAGRALALNAHHAHIHTGKAGEALSRTGKFVLPTAPLFPLPIAGCDDLKAFFPA